MNGLERPCRSQMLWTHHDLQIARLDLFHAAFKYDAAAIDEHKVSEDMLDLFDMMRRQQDGAVAIKVIIQQGVVKLLAIENVEAKRGLVEHQQFRVNGHYQRKVQLGHHAL